MVIIILRSLIWTSRSNFFMEEWFPWQVWSFVRRFDQPQRYKPFVSRCIMQGDFAVGCLREVNIKTGLPATTSTERLELLDDDERILSIKIVGGDHRLQVFCSSQPSSAKRLVLSFLLPCCKI